MARRVVSETNNEGPIPSPEAYQTNDTIGKCLY
jgi:hypothetical protein